MNTVDHTGVPSYKMAILATENIPCFIFISQLLKGLSSSVIYHWKAKYLRNIYVNSFLHNIIYTIVLKSVKHCVCRAEQEWRVQY